MLHQQPCWSCSYFYNDWCPFSNDSIANSNIKKHKWSKYLSQHGRWQSTLHQHRACSIARDLKSVRIAFRFIDKGLLQLQNVVYHPWYLKLATEKRLAKKIHWIFLQHVEKITSFVKRDIDHIYWLMINAWNNYWEIKSATPGTLDAQQKSALQKMIHKIWFLQMLTTGQSA